MNYIKITALLLPVTLLLSSGCNGSIPALEETVKPVEMTQCTDPRPEVCTMDYTPVCATKKDGNTKTFFNGCAACTNSEVIGHRPNSCEED